MVYKHFWGRTQEGTAVIRFTLFNAHSMEVNVSNLGAAVLSVCTPNKDGEVANVMPGAKALPDLALPTPGKMLLNAAAGETPDPVMWKWRTQEMDSLVILQRSIEAGEEGCTGALQLEVSFWLTNDDALVIHTTATAQTDTTLCPGCGLAFDLSGVENAERGVQRLEIPARSYSKTNGMSLPEDAFTDVSGTPYDFTTPHACDLPEGHKHGICWQLEPSETPENPLHAAAELTEPVSGRKLTIYSTAPLLRVAEQDNALLLEPLHCAHEEGKSGFSPVVLHAGETFDAETVYYFGLMGDDSN